VSEPMLDILKALAHGVGGMTYGDPDDADAIKAADVVRWAVEEITRLREENETLLESQLWGVNCKPSSPGPEGNA
jgi:hypothetical protein